MMRCGATFGALGREYQRGIDATVIQLGDPARIGGDALLARRQALANGVRVVPFGGRRMDFVVIGVLAANFIIDIVYVVVDPSVRLGMESG